MARNGCRTLTKTESLVWGWPKSLFRFFHEMVQKNLNKLFGQPKTEVI